MEISMNPNLPTISFEEYQDVLQNLEMLTDLPKEGIEVMCYDIQGKLCNISVERVRKTKTNPRRFRVLANVERAVNM
jgi:hypothetical protein